MKAILGFYLMALFTSPSFAAELVHKGKAAPLPQGSERPNAKAAGEVDLILKVPEGLKTIEELHTWLQTLNLPEGEVVVKLGAHWCPPCQALIRSGELSRFAERKRGQVKVVSLDLDEHRELAKLLHPRMTIPALVPLKNDGTSKPEAAILRYLPGQSSPIGDFLKAR